MHHPWSQYHNPFNVPLPFWAPRDPKCRCRRGQRTNPTNVAKTINGIRYFIHTTSILWIEEDITKDASYRSMGMLST